MNYFPPWGWGPPPPQDNRGPSRKEIERAIRMAFNLRDAPKKEKRKRKEEASKKAAHTRAKMFTFIEVFIIGVVAQPFVGLLYDALLHKLQAH